MLKVLYMVVWVMVLAALLYQGTLANGEKQEIENRLNNLSQDNAEGYLNPLLKSFAYNLNSGLYHTAASPKGFDIYIGLKAIVALIPTSEKYYHAISPLSGSFERTATVIGDNGAAEYFPDGFRWDVVPLWVPQLHLGNFYGTQLMFRYLPSTRYDEKIGNIDLIGGGVMHNVSQYFPWMPLQISLQGVIQSMKVGNIIEATGQSYHLIASKSFAGLTLYGGLSIESTDFTVNYEYAPDYSPQVLTTTPGSVQFGQIIDDRYRATLGLSVRLIIFNINADYSFGDYQIATLGLGVAI